MIFEDILDDAKDEAADLGGAVKDFKKTQGKFKKSSKSIMKAAKGNVFEFPVFIANSVPLDYAEATVSLLEQVYASYLQMAISINPVIDDDMARKGAQFDHLRSDTNKYLECVDPTDMPYAYDACHNVFVEDGIRYEFNLANIEDSTARIINEAMDHQPLSEFDHYFNEAYIGDGAGFFEGCEFIQEAKKTDIPEKRKFTDDDFKKTTTKTHHEDKGTVYMTDSKHDPIISPVTNEPYEIERYSNKNDTTESNPSVFERIEKEDEYYQLTLQIAELKQKLEFNKKYQPKQLEEMNKKLSKLEHEKELAWQKLQDYADDHGLQKEINEKTKARLEKEISKMDREELEAAKTQADRLSKIKHDARKSKADADRAEKEIERLEREDKWAKEDRNLDRMKKMNEARVKTPQFLDETKIQKLNTMKPLMMTVDLNVVDKNGSLSRPVSYIVGVKCHTRIIESDILPEVAAYPLKEMNKKLRKVRWRAGELKFGRDILWKKTSKKQTASDSRDPKRKWYRRLYELAHMSGDGTAAASVKNGKSPWANWWKDKLTGGNNADVGHGLIPNATIVMSKADIDNIKREKDIDLLKGSKATKFCKELFLIGLIVIDDDKESIKVIFPDYHNDYEVHSLAAIKKQLAMLDTAGTKTRDIMKILG